MHPTGRGQATTTCSMIRKAVVAILSMMIMPITIFLLSLPSNWRYYPAHQDKVDSDSYIIDDDSATQRRGNSMHPECSGVVSPPLLCDVTSEKASLFCCVLDDSGENKLKNRLDTKDNATADLGTQSTQDDKEQINPPRSSSSSITSPNEVDTTPPLTMRKVNYPELPYRED